MRIESMCYDKNGELSSFCIQWASEMQLMATANIVNICEFMKLVYCSTSSFSLATIFVLVLTA